MASYTPAHPHDFTKSRKSIGLILLLYGAMLIIGAGIGGGTLLQPLRGLQGSSSSNTASTTQHGVEFQRFKGVSGLQQVLDEAHTNKQPVMLDPLGPAGKRPGYGLSE